MLIVFEGIDGSGKSTQSALLYDYLNSRGITTYLSGPFETEYGKALKRIFLGHTDISLRTQTFLIASVMSHLVEQFEKHPSHTVIILDRFIYTTYAYHGVASGIGVDFINKVYSLALPYLSPDFIFYLDINPLHTAHRISRQKDRIEESSIEFFNNVRSAYLDLVHSIPNWLTIDGTRSQDDIHNYVIQSISGKI